MPKGIVSKENRREQRHEHRLRPYKKSTTFFNLLVRRKKYHDAWARWFDENKAFLVDGDRLDARTLTYFHFKFKNHGRHSKSEFTKDNVYERIALLLFVLDSSDGLVHGQEVFFRYMTDSHHSNLAVKNCTLKRAVMQVFSDKNILIKLVGNKDLKV